MIYYELSDLYEENVKSDILENKLKEKDYIKFYAFILHNRTKDVKPHFHILIQVDLNNKKAKSRIEKHFKDFKPFVKCVRNPKGFARYLQHLDYIDKEKYEDNEIRTNNFNQFNDLKHIDNKKSSIERLLEEFYNYLLIEVGEKGEAQDNGDLFKWFLNKGQGNYFLCHSKSIIELANNFRHFENTYYEEMERRNNINVDNFSNIDYTNPNPFI